MPRVGREFGATSVAHPSTNEMQDENAKLSTESPRHEDQPRRYSLQRR